MKKTVDFTVVWYLSLAMALVTLFPSIGMKSVFANLSSGLFLFLEAMSTVIYFFGIAMTSWYLISEKSVATIKKIDNEIKVSTNASRSDGVMVLVLFLAFTPSYPNQKQLLFLLAANAFARLCFTFLKRKSLIKNKDKVK